MLRRLGILAGWCGAAFALQTAFAMATFTGITTSVLIVYVLGLAAMFPLQPKTRGALAMVVSFGLCWGLIVEGLCYAVAAGEAPFARRIGIAAALAVPLVALVVRRAQADTGDAVFARLRRRVVPFALVVAIPLLAAGMLGARRADPAPYERARRVLGFNPFETLLFKDNRNEQSLSRWTAFQSPWSGVAPAIRDEVSHECGRFVGSNPVRASVCADGILVSRYRAVEQRRDVFRSLALASALPWALVFFFAWRSRGRREGSLAPAGLRGTRSDDGVSDD